MTSDKSETLSRPLRLPLSDEALSRVTSEEHTLPLMRRWALGLGQLSGPVSWAAIRSRLVTLVLIKGL